MGWVGFSKKTKNDRLLISSSKMGWPPPATIARLASPSALSGRRARRACKVRKSAHLLEHARVQRAHQVDAHAVGQLLDVRARARFLVVAVVVPV